MNIDVNNYADWEIQSAQGAIARELAKKLAQKVSKEAAARLVEARQALRNAKTDYDIALDAAVRDVEG